MTEKYKAILFDLGGVIIELAGMPTMMAWTEHTLSESEFWERWLTSQAVRSFESGNSTPEVFSKTIIDEFNLPVSHETFLEAFLYWPRRTLPGAEEILEDLSPRYLLGTLSNTNVLHWERFEQEMRFLHYFDHHFPSHLTGFLKPDQGAFENAAQTLDLNPTQILFFDDNLLNVQGARSAGMTAHVVIGTEELSVMLKQLGCWGKGTYNRNAS